MALRRFDSGSLQAVERTPGGGLKIPAYVTRTGVFPYKLTDGTTRRELRLPEEVFHPDSIASLAHAPVTDLHPPVPVTADTWKDVSIGHIGASPVQAGDHLAASLYINDAGAINRIDSGERKEVSSAYDVGTLDATPGVYNGEPYDAIQRGIRYNHVAIGPVGWGRAGPTVAMHLDSADAVQIPQDENTMNKIRLDGVEYVVGSPEHLAKIDAMHAAELAALKATSEGHKGRADAAESTLVQVRKDLTAATDPKAIAARADSRAKLLVRAVKVLGKPRADAISAEAEPAADTAIMVEMIQKMEPAFDPAGKSPEFILAYFAGKFSALMADESAEAPATDGGPGPVAGPPPGNTGAAAPPMAHDSIWSVRGGAPVPTDKPDADKAAGKMRTDNRDAWKTPLAMSKK